VVHHHPPGGHHHASERCGHEHGHSHWEEELKDSPLVSDQGGRLGGDQRPVRDAHAVTLRRRSCRFTCPACSSAGAASWVLSLILAVATLAGMMLFTWLTLVGLERFEVKNFERYEAGLLGALFTLLGGLLLVLGH
jgi:nickel/cobalt exporter